MGRPRSGQSSSRLADELQPPPKQKPPAARSPLDARSPRLEIETRGESLIDCRNRATDIASRYFGRWRTGEFKLRQITARPVLASAVTAAGQIDDAVQYFVTEWLAIGDD